MTDRVQAEVSLRTAAGRNDYRFMLSHAHQDRLLFAEECFRFRSSALRTEPPWQHLGSGHQETQLGRAACGDHPDVNPTSARAVRRQLRNCSVFQFHDTSRTSSLHKSWDAQDKAYLRSDAGNLAAVLRWLEGADAARYEKICNHIGRMLPTFDGFQLTAEGGQELGPAARPAPFGVAFATIEAPERAAPAAPGTPAQTHGGRTRVP